MSTHDLCFRAKIRKIYTPVNIKVGCIRGSILYGHVRMMGSSCLFSFYFHFGLFCSIMALNNL